MTDALDATVPYDIVSADLPPGILLDAASGRMFRIEQLTEGERLTMLASTPALADREVVIAAVRGRLARQRCSELRSDYDRAAAAAASANDGQIHRYAVRPSPPSTSLVSTAQTEA